MPGSKRYQTYSLCGGVDVPDDAGIPRPAHVPAIRWYGGPPWVAEYCTTWLSSGNPPPDAPYVNATWNRTVFLGFPWKSNRSVYLASSGLQCS
jgi:hypothetical protein